jgi:hypothetical protein
VINDHWLLSGALTGGIQVGNRIEQIKKGSITANLTNLLRFSVGYNNDNWGISLDFIGNVQYYSLLTDGAFNLFSGDFGIKYLKRFYHVPFFSKNKAGKRN